MNVNPTPQTPSFNPDQLCTIEQAIAFAVRVDAEVPALFPTKVAPIDATDDYHNDKSGIYLPPWANPTGDTPEPGIGDTHPFALRFDAVLDPQGYQPQGFNVGLSITVAKGHSAHDNDGVWLGEYNWDYALRSLSAEVNQQIESARIGN